MTDEAAVAWLRERIEGDARRAEISLRRWPGRLRWLDVVADCEAKLAILDWCLLDESVEAAAENGDISSAEYATAAACGATTLRLLARAYRHRDGYEKHWGQG